MTRSILKLCATALVFAPVAASAHPAIGSAAGLAMGFAQPDQGA